MSNVELGLVVTTLVIAYGLVVGWQNFGWTDWAFVNRGIGWGIILAYVATGALVSFAMGKKWLDIFSACFVATAAALVLVDCALLLASDFGLPFDRVAVPPRMMGLSQNPNAFAFQLLLAFSVSLAFGRDVTAPPFGQWRQVLEGILLAGIWLSMSRSAFITLAVLMITLMVTRRASWRRFVLPISISLGVVIVLVLVSLSSSDGVLVVRAMKQVASHKGLRLYSLIAGLDLWRDNWLFGAGLGAFVHSEVQAKGVPLVIHSTPIWILAEMGVLGFLAIAGTFANLVRQLVASSRVRPEPPIIAALCCLLIIAIEMQVHEMFYQRAFWLILGAMLASPIGVLVRSSQPGPSR